MIAAQEEKFQGFVHQALSHMMSMQSMGSPQAANQQSMAMLGSPPRMTMAPSGLAREDVEMYTPEEIAQMNADYYEYMRTQRGGTEQAFHEILKEELAGYAQMEQKELGTPSQ